MAKEYVTVVLSEAFAEKFVIPFIQKAKSFFKGNDAVTEGLNLLEEAVQKGLDEYKEENK